MREIDARSVILIRTDRMGDLILSTPLFQAIKGASPACRVIVVAAPYAAPVLEGNPHVDEILLWDARSGAITENLARRRIEAAIVLNPGLASCRAAWSARIPFRTGPLSRPSSFLFLNRGVRQSRSRSGKHQSELDAEFAALVTGGRASGTPLPFLRVTEGEREAGWNVLRESGAPEGKPLAGMHPGSGRSALGWPEDRWVRLGRLLIDDGWTVVVTGGPSESGAARRVAASIGPGARAAAGGTDLRVFLGLLSHLRLFVAPSTGPLHAAAALGVPVAAPFPPLPSQAQERWGPRGPRTAVHVPPVECPARIRCRGKRCRHYDCMERIEPEDLHRSIRVLCPGEGGSA